MTGNDPKDELLRYLRRGRDALVAKTDGLSPYDAHRPMTPTGTNLLGLLKHVAYVQAAYFGAVFGRPFPEAVPWDVEGGAADDDMWATPEESRDDIVDLLRRSSVHADATIEALPLDAVGEVPWWPPERRSATLHLLLVHMVAEVHRHAGHADIVRELIDGLAGLRQPGENLPDRDAEAWSAYREKIEAAARTATS